MEKEKVLLEATLCYLWKKDDVLFARKTRGIRKGKLNGYGGGPEEGESLEEACVRELFEESGLKSKSENFKKVAIIYFHNTKTDGTVFVCKVHVYFLHDWSGEFGSGDGGMVDPKFYSKSNLPWDEMSPGDIYWLPPVLHGRKIVAHISYGPFQKELNGPIEIREVEYFSDDD